MKKAILVTGAAGGIGLATCKALDGHTFAKICEAVGAGNATLEGTVLTLDAYTSVVLE